MLAGYNRVTISIASGAEDSHTFNISEHRRVQYVMRNLAMHGKFDQVIEDRAGTQHKLKDVEHFRRCVHALAILYFLNPDQDGTPNLRRFIKQLRRGQAVNLKKL